MNKNDNIKLLHSKASKVPIAGIAVLLIMSYMVMK